MNISSQIHKEGGWIMKLQRSDQSRKFHTELSDFEKAEEELFDILKSQIDTWEVEIGV